MRFSKTQSKRSKGNNRISKRSKRSSKRSSKRIRVKRNTYKKHGGNTQDMSSWTEKQQEAYNTEIEEQKILQQKWKEEEALDKRAAQEAVASRDAERKRITDTQNDEIGRRNIYYDSRRREDKIVGDRQKHINETMREYPNLSLREKILPRTYVSKNIHPIYPGIKYEGQTELRGEGIGALGKGEVGEWDVYDPFWWGGKKSKKSRKIRF